jgi:hypothetical protein
MVISKGFVPQEKPIPHPDMSYVRMFNDNSVGWQFRGQYVFWTGHVTQANKKYKLLERIENRVARIEDKNGETVFHKIAAGTPFTVENLMGYWITFDSDAMWLDVKSSDGQYAALMVGGSTGKPGETTIDWTCRKCGKSIAPKVINIIQAAFNKFLSEANNWVQAFNDDPAMRSCVDCGAEHPLSYGTAQEEYQK